MLNLWWTCTTRLALKKWPFECQNPSTGAKDTVIFVSMSADLYSHCWADLTIGLALKNYPKMTLWMSKSIHWIQRYSDICFEVSWFVQSQLIWPHDWIGLEKLPKNDPLNVKIRPLDPKIQWYLILSQLICTVTADLTSQLDWPWKATPKWPFECQNLSTGSKVIVVLYKT